MAYKEIECNHTLSQEQVILIDHDAKPGKDIVPIYEDRLMTGFIVDVVSEIV
jgi:hypothetical protein